MKRRKLVDPIVVVHGGAGKISCPETREFMLDEVKKAAKAASNMLSEGHSSLDAVEHAICHMETKEYFNCAYGGSLNENNEVVMDAAIMTNTLRAGCVGAVTNIKHPITLAKRILEDARHILIIEHGAQEIASQLNVPIVSSEEFIATPKSKDECSTKPDRLQVHQFIRVLLESYMREMFK